MIQFERTVLDNGLRVIAHEDANTPLVAVNLAYYVGSRDEDPHRTGFAHLFEHLMFSGSRHVKDFDEPLQRAGGDNNAYTTNDYTTFYCQLPKANIETALWLESDRMMSLRINKRSLDVQRKVVVEEFKETCLNEPYGDSWHHLSDLMYSLHPYRWPVIGLSPEHIEQASVEEVKAFYQRWYTPRNAILSICGHIKPAEALRLAERWFGEIPAGEPLPQRVFPIEAPKGGRRVIEAANVPVPAVFLAFRTPARMDPEFYPVDLLTDILAQGHSSRLYRRLLREKRLFSQIDAYVTANIDPGLLVIEGRPVEGVSPDEALTAIWLELEDLKKTPIDERELEKVKHRFESTVVISETNILNKAQNLGYYEILKDAAWINDEVGVYMSARPEDLHRMAQHIFKPEESATLIYLPTR